ncbi:cytochrome P450 [Dacryopinax primogenitus]|uniref:Cytochrome P450 n=1 Tax=Dacryopinax primogenitus (strain DJM 731) TaxID=1858805 RepID=M5GB87_DACPD|nr:cytochrome P450 [Dacryopinax primogenitus]EJU01233.1 cytochrome P450 [Dacryopinax primogenitus]
MSLISTVIYAAIVVVALVGAYRLSQTGKRDKVLPPGPPTRPVVGNLFDIPPRYAHLKFTEWSKQYGPVISCKLFGSTMVVLNDAGSVMELMDKRSGSSSDRAPSYINSEFISANNHPLLVGASRSVLMRKIYNTALAQRRVPDYLPLQNAESVVTMRNILHDPENFYEELRRISCSLALTIAFGKRAPTFSGKDAIGFSVEHFYHVAHAFNFFLEVGAAPPLDMFPILKYVPAAFAEWKGQAIKLRQQMQQLYHTMLLGEVKERLQKSQSYGCWMESVIQRNEASDDMMKAWVGGGMMEAGSDTTSSVLLTFVLAAVLHPEKVSKAQAELDAVVGSDRSPKFEDLESLPYCRAFVLEVMRWRPILPAGVPHMTSKDEMYNGMLIPAGTVLVQNTWAVLHDPAMHDDPELFMPERFLEHKYGLKKGLPEDPATFRNTFGYGAGRRICLGLYFAENTIKVMVAKMLWAFNFGLKIDTKTGKPIPVRDDDFHPGHITAPEPFKCSITPRGDAYTRTIEEELKEVTPMLAQYERGISA